MRLGTIVLAALAAVADPSRAALAQSEELPAGAKPGVEPAAKATEGNIEHRPVERNIRGNPIVVRAKIPNPSTIFAPLVFARPAGTQRYGAYSMVDQGARGFVARLPASLLNEGSFEYFIEARHDEGDATRFGSPARPVVCVAYDPPPRPVKATFRTAEPGATVKIDDNDVGKTPITVAIGPGPHVIQVIAPDGRSTEQHLDVKPGKKIDVVLPLPTRTGGPSSLTVTSDPEQARVFIDGAAAGVTPYAGELAPGTHSVAVESTGRLRQERQVVGRPGRDVQLAFVLPVMPKDPALTIESDPVGAIVLVDGKERGRTPFLAPVPPGRHDVLLRAPGRRDLAIEFTMPREKDLSLKKEMAPASASARVTIASIPEDAALAIDGKEVGPSPWSGELRAGEHSVQVRRGGYFGAERTFAVQTTRDLYLSFPLERIAGPGQLRVETDPPDAELSIDGQKPVPAPYVGELSTGDHNVEVSSVGYRSVAQQITMAPGQQISLRLTLSPATGGNVPPIVGVNSAPEGAMLYLDGKPVGPTPRKAITTAGQHELRLVLDGYKTWAAPTRVPDKPGYELRVAVVLKPVREAEAVVTPDSMELARAQYKRAEACYAAGDYACAATGYRTAYEQSRRPELLFNIGQAERHQGNMKEALTSYEGFLREKKDPNPKIKLQAEQYIAFCQLVL
ncbi:MAG TPA: PEGA domain-containing protein, partial [Myxococcales bacterium]|nr:PEGA domain-containing protein [Myxococcales bacterium]